MASTHCLSSGTLLHRVDFLSGRRLLAMAKLAVVSAWLASFHSLLQKKEQHCLALSKHLIASKGLCGSHDHPRTTGLTESGSRVQLCGKASEPFDQQPHWNPRREDHSHKAKKCAVTRREKAHWAGRCNSC